MMVTAVFPNTAGGEFYQSHHLQAMRKHVWEVPLITSVAPQVPTQSAEHHCQVPEATKARLRACSKPRNLMMDSVTDGCNRRPPLYGPIALLNCTL